MTVHQGEQEHCTAFWTMGRRYDTTNTLNTTLVGNQRATVLFSSHATWVTRLVNASPHHLHRLVICSTLLNTGTRASSDDHINTTRPNPCIFTPADLIAQHRMILIHDKQPPSLHLV